MLGLLSILIGLLLPQNKSLDAQLKNYLDDRLNSYVKYEYQVVHEPKNYSRIEINKEKKSRLSKNYLYLPVNIYGSKNLLSSSILTIRLKLYKNVLAAAKEIGRNEILTENFFEVNIVDVSMYEGRQFDVDENLSNYRSKILIKTGTILSRDMVEPVPLVNKGDKVILHTGGTGVDVSIDVVARQDGCVGEVISVYSNGNKLYKGKIVDKNNITLVE